MAEFSITGGSNGGSYAQYFTGKLSVWENSYDIASNTSNVGYKLELISGNYGRFIDYYGYFDVYINGVHVLDAEGYKTLNAHNTAITLGEGTLTVEHNANGAKTISCSATIDMASGSSSPGDFNLSGSLELTTIPRYMDYVWISQRGRTSTSISIDWSTSHPRDWTQYSINGGAWTDAGDVITSDKTGYFTVGGLSPNTTYNIKIQCRRTDSKLWSESGSLSIRTYQQTIASVSLSSKTSTSITVKSSCNVSVSSTSYRKKASGGSWGDWQTSPTFTGLSPNTTYVIQVVKVGTESGEAGDADVSIKTYQQTIASISLSSKTVNSITVTSSCNVSASYTHYRKKQNGGNWEDWQTSSTFTELSPNTTYIIQVEKYGSESGEYGYAEIKITTYDKSKITRCDNFNSDSNPYMEFTNPSGSTLNLKLEFKGTTIRRNGITGSGSYTFELTEAERKLLYESCWDSNELDVRYVVATLVNGKETYWAYDDKTMTVVNSNPIFTNCEYKDIGEGSVKLTEDNQTVINGYNVLRVVISPNNRAIAKNEARMERYRLVCGNKTVEQPYSEDDEVVLEIGYVESMTFMVYAIDSRENSPNPVTKTFTSWKDYFKPSITAGEAERTEQVNKETRLTFSGKIWNDNFGAVPNKMIVCKYEYKKTTDSEYIAGDTEITPEISGNTFSASLLIRGDADTEGFEITNSYNIRITIADETGNRSIYNVLLNAGTPAFAIHKDGAAFGAPYNESVGGPLQVHGVQIIESGNNNNGSWVKFADGTMICRATKPTGVITWTADAVSNVFLASGTFDDFPQTFKEVPDVVKSISYITPTNRYVDMCGQGAPSTANAGSFNLKTYWNASNTNVRASYIAIGKWR